MEKIVCKKMTIEKKCLQKIISHPALSPPPEKYWSVPKQSVNRKN